MRLRQMTKSYDFGVRVMLFSASKCLCMISVVEVAHFRRESKAMCLVEGAG
jgi:hypothetical protein